MMATLVQANKALTNGMNGLAAELKAVVAASDFSPPQCEPLQEPENGVVAVIGDHGDKVPVSVIASFSCNAGFFFESEDDTATCQHDSDDGAKWSSPGKHPGTLQPIL
jgi:hypothetical protein